MGPLSPVKVRETSPEPTNLFVVCVAEPEVGKYKQYAFQCHYPQVIEIDDGFVDRFAICSLKVRLLLEGRAGRME